MWINKRAEEVDQCTFTIEMPKGPDLQAEIICDQSGMLHIVSCQHGNVLYYHAMLMAWTSGDKGHGIFNQDIVP